MAAMCFERDLRPFEELYLKPVTRDWPFKAMLTEVESTAPSTPRRKELLKALSEGSKRKI
jgi:hypothetical protein